MSKHVVFCWELGAGTGHVDPYLPLLDELAKRGWQVTLAARNTAEIAVAALQRGFRLVQAPVCGHEFSGVAKNAYSFAEILLHFGYGHETTLRGLLASWRSLFELAKPDLVLASAAPTAQLAALSMGVPQRMIGSGFNCPPATNPLPLMRDWIPGIEQRLAGAEASFCRSTKVVLGEIEGARIEQMSPQQLFGESEPLLCTFAELDHYPQRPNATSYLGVLSARKPAANQAPQCDVFAYLRQSTHTEPLLAALDKLGLETLVYCPDAPVEIKQRWGHKSLRFSETPVDVAKVLPGCRFIVNYASHNLTAEALLAGKPLLQLPVHLEQEMTARRVVQLGAGISVADHERNPKFARLFAQILHEPEYAESAQGFSARYADWHPEAAVDAAVNACEEAASPSQDRHLKVASL